MSRGTALDRPSWRSFFIALMALWRRRCSWRCIPGAAAEEGHLFVAGMSRLRPWRLPDGSR